MREIHPRSCVHCKWNEVVEIDNGYGGYLRGEFASVCNGRKGSIGNLKHFPFVTEQKCFKPRGDK